MSIPFQLDARSLLQVQTALSFATAAFTAPPYNLAIFLFGVYAIDQTTSNDALRLFAGMLGCTLVLDLVWMIRHNQAIMIRLLSILILILKVPTLSTVVASLRQRGDYFASRLGSGDLGGSTIWTMPGGFTRQSGYDSLDSGEAAANYADAPIVPADGTSRIPQVVHAPRPQPPQGRAPAPPAAPPGGYESV